MRRTIDQSLIDLREQVIAWASRQARPDVRVFVYPPEWEASMLVRLPEFARQCADEQYPIEIVDLGQRFVAELRRRTGFVDRIAELERRAPDRALHDLGELATRTVTRLLTEPLEPPNVCRLLVNAGALSTFTSYSAITNGVDPSMLPAPIVLAFPGEGDERSLNLLRLRTDTNYRVPRI